MKLNNSVKVIVRDNKMLVYFSEKGDIFETNEVGKFIIEKIGQGFSEKQIVKALVEETKKDSKKIEADVKKFLKLLRSKGIIE